MEASRPQPGMLEGLSRFLVQHERCGAGFDVAHQAGLGSGRVSITCRGCGARHEYATATIEAERELIAGAAEPAQAEHPTEPAPEPPAIPPRPAPYPESRRPVTPAAGEGEARPRPRRRVDLTHGADQVPAGPAAPDRDPAAPPRAERPGLSAILRSPRTTVVLLVITAAAVAFAVLRLVNDNGGETTRPAARPSPPPSAAPSGPSGLPIPAKPPTESLRTERFTLRVPPGWARETAGGGLLLRPPDDRRVNVQIYYERSPGLSAAQMARDTADFLRREVPGASLYPRQVEIGSARSNELTARGPGETAIAVNVLRGPYRYLIVRRIYAGAKPHTSLDAGRIVRSFRPS